MDSLGTQMRDESEKEIVHRLEAFSDIVIGFGLAQLGLSLTIPKHVRDLFAHTHGLSTLGAFAMTFVLICSLWWMHHKLFRHLFVPTRLNIALNFAALGGVLFYAYVMQVLVHVGFRDQFAFPLYLGCYAYITLLFSAIAWSGLISRRERMPEDVRGTSTDFTIRLTILAAGFSAMTAAVLIAGPNENLFPVMMVLIVVALLILRVVTRRRRRLSSPST